MRATTCGWDGPCSNYADEEMSPMKATAAAATDIGLVRDHNEDAHLSNEPLYIVADGMGGHLGGEVASSIALETVSSAFAENGAEGLADAVRRANTAVFERSSSDPEVAGMGTTITVAVQVGARLRLAHVGDSRAYLFRAGRLQQYTDDHTLVGEMVRDGSLTEQQARTHPRRSILSRALGTGPDIVVDELEIELGDGDRLLLCSDGLNAMIDDAAIGDILAAQSEPQVVADALVAAAKRAGGSDNITVIVVDFSDDHDDESGGGDGDDGNDSTATSTDAQTAPAPETAPTGRDERPGFLKRLFGKKRA
jgi:serine/threonine protein phosphatase PrpC